jgi:hypothetical protein
VATATEISASSSSALQGRASRCPSGKINRRSVYGKRLSFEGKRAVRHIFVVVPLNTKASQYVLRRERTRLSCSMTQSSLEDRLREVSVHYFGRSLRRFLVMLHSNDCCYYVEVLCRQVVCYCYNAIHRQYKNRLEPLNHRIRRLLSSLRQSSGFCHLRWQLRESESRNRIVFQSSINCIFALHIRCRKSSYLLV